MSQKQYLTREGYEALKKKLEELKQEQKENIVALQDARAQGDLSENADYDAARDNQARIAAAIKEVENSLKNAVIVDGEEGNNFGKILVLNFLEERDENDNAMIETYKLVGTSESNPLENKISIESPLGRALMHAKVGDTVLVKTEDGLQFEVRLEKISTPEVATPTKRTTKKK